MKSSLGCSIQLFLGFLFVWGLILTLPIKPYQAGNEGGLFRAVSFRTQKYQEKLPRMVFEKKPDDSNSEVLRVKGLYAFKRFVLAQSLFKPVVVKVYSSVGADFRKSCRVFQKVADVFKGQVFFVSMDILGQPRGSLGNYQLIQKLMRHANINRLQLPTFLFFKNGMLCTPNHLPSSILQGIHTQKNLVTFINRKFFSTTNFSSGASGMDVTTTGTDSRSNLDKKSIRGKVKNDRSVWGRLKRFFGVIKK